VYAIGKLALEELPPTAMSTTTEAASISAHRWVAWTGTRTRAVGSAMNILFLHYWGHGKAADLAATVKKALDLTAWDGASTTT
jgi:hypothetical protein